MRSIAPHALSLARFAIAALARETSWSSSCRLGGGRDHLLGATYAGAVVVPVVHFYGAKELSYIVQVTQPALLVTADRFGKSDYVGAYEGLITELNIPWAVVGDADAQLPPAAVPFEKLLEADPVAGPVEVDPDSPALIAFTSGTTRDPKGAIDSHRTLGFEARQLGGLSPEGGPPSLVGAPVGHFIGMLNAFVCSLIRHEAINMIDVWNPQEVLRLMRDEQLNVGGGSTYFRRARSIIRTSRPTI